MMVPCCMSYRTATRIIALYHMVANALFIVFMAFLVIGLQAVVEQGTNGNDNELNISSSGEVVDVTTAAPMVAAFADKDANIHTINVTDNRAILDGNKVYISLELFVLAILKLGNAILLVLLMLSVILFVLSYELYRGASLYNWSRCKGWMYVKAALLIVSVFAVPVKLSLYGTGQDIDYVPVALVTLFGFIVEVYVLCVVASFIHETKTTNANSKLTYTKA